MVWEFTIDAFIFSSCLHLLRERITYLLLTHSNGVCSCPLLATEIWSRWYHEMHWLVRKSSRIVQITLLKRALKIDCQQWKQWYQIKLRDSSTWVDVYFLHNFNRNFQTFILNRFWNAIFISINFSQFIIWQRRILLL